MLKTLAIQTHTRGLSNLVRLQGLALHVEVPDLGGQVVPGQQVASAVAELYVRHGGDDL